MSILFNCNCWPLKLEAPSVATFSWKWERCLLLWLRTTLNLTYWYSSSPDTLITRTPSTPNKLITWSCGQNINCELSKFFLWLISSMINGSTALEQKPESGSTKMKWDNTGLALQTRMYCLASLSTRWDGCQTQSIALNRAFCSFHSLGGRVCRRNWDCRGTSHTFTRGTPTCHSRPWTHSQTWSRTLQLRNARSPARQFPCWKHPTDALIAFQY